MRETRPWSLLAAISIACAAGPASAQPVKLRAEPSVYVDSKGAPLKEPEGVACDASTLVVADTGGGRVVRYEIAESGVIPKGELLLPELPYPVRVALAGKGDLLVLDGKSRRIGRVGPAGEFKGYLPIEAAEGAGGAAIRSFKVGADGSIYALDAASARVVVLGEGGAVARQIALPDEARFVSDIAVDGRGTVFLLDSVGSRVYMAGTGAAAATLITGSLGEDLDFATSLAVDNHGHLFLADQAGSGIVILASDGAFRGRQSGMGWTEGLLRFPSGVCVNDKGALFVADRENNRIAVFRIAP